MRAPLPPEALQVNRRRPRSFRLLIFPLYSSFVLGRIVRGSARWRHLREQSRVFLFDLYRSKFRGFEQLSIWAQVQPNSLFSSRRRNCSIGKDTVSQTEETREETKVKRVECLRGSWHVRGEEILSLLSGFKSCWSRCADILALNRSLISDYWYSCEKTEEF